MGNLTSYCPPVQWEKKEGGYEYRRDFLERVVDTISPLQEHQRVFRNFDGDITNRIHPVSYAEKGDKGEGTRYEYDSDGNCIRIRYPDGGVERLHRAVTIADGHPAAHGVITVDSLLPPGRGDAAGVGAVFLVFFESLVPQGIPLHDASPHGIVLFRGLPPFIAVYLLLYQDLVMGIVIGIQGFPAVRIPGAHKVVVFVISQDVRQQ